MPYTLFNALCHLRRAVVGKLTLQLSGYPKAVQRKIADVLGRVVLKQKVAASQTQTQLNLSDSATGV